MFRGGRVDARGTGITSNLGYEAGGRVGYADRGLVRTGGKGNTWKPRYTAFSQQAMPWLQRAINTTDEYIPVPERTIRGVTTGGGLRKNPDYIPKTTTKYVGRYNTPMQVKLTDEQRTFTEGDFHPGEAELWREPADTSGTGNGDGGAGTPEKTKAEKLAEYQELFEEAYGSGRGDDISNMLLSFAGKALKPEATVKSSFGEFFEDEAKRPSERKKYKDAATTAAINAFLAGETSYQKFQDDLLSYSNKLGIQSSVAKALEKDKTWADLWSESKEPSTTKKNKNTSQKWLDKENIDKFVKETNSKKEPTEDLFIEENIGEYYIDQHTGEFFKIIRLEDDTIGKARKG